MMEKKLGEWVIRYRWLIIVLTVIIAVSIASGGRYLSFSTNYRVFFSDENPELMAFEDLQDTYTKNDNVMLVIAPKNGNVFTRETLGAVKELTEASWQVPYSLRVDSLTNFQHTWAQEDDLIVQDLVEDPSYLPQEELNRIKAVALNEPLIVNRLLSPSAHVTAVNVIINFPQESLTEVPEVAAFVRAMAEDFRSRYPGIDIYISGIAMLNNAFMEASQDDLSTLIPIMYGVLILVMGILLRSFIGTFSTLMVMVFSMITAVGFAGWVGYPLTPISANAPTIILTLAVADSIHILTTLFHEMRMGRSKREAIGESLRINLQPVFLTSVTTAIGFLSMNFSESPPFHHLGNMVAVGVIAAFFYSILFLPALVAVLPLRVREKGDGYAFMDRFANFVVIQRTRLFWGMSAVILLLIAMIPLNELGEHWTTYFDKRYAFRTDTDFISKNLSGIYTLQYSVGAGGEGKVSDPVFLKNLETFADWFREQPEVVHVSVLTDVMKRLNRNMHGDDPSYDFPPSRHDLAAQYLLLYEMSLPFGLDLNNQINLDKSATRLVVSLHDLSTRSILSIQDRAREWQNNNLPGEMQSAATSPAIMFSHIVRRNINSMLGGTSLALVLISLILIATLRSVRLGLLSLAPNLVPAGMAFGLWGLMVGQISMGTSIVAALSLGIVVDDTVHFLSKYHRARKEHNMEAPEAVRYAFHTVGMALWITSMVLIAGFAVLNFSGFSMNSEMGVLTSITIAIALIVDFLFLPPLLMMLDRGKEEEKGFSREGLSAGQVAG